jgi:hypothetical protein
MIGSLDMYYLCLNQVGDVIHTGLDEQRRFAKHTDLTHNFTYPRADRTTRRYSRW